MKKRKHWWVWLIVFAYIGWIFHNSLMVAETSARMSYIVANRLIGPINRYGLYIDFQLFHRYVRKLAHFSEFAGLGFLVSIAMGVCPLFRSRFLNFILFFISIPVMDETIQRYTAGRSSEVFDMFIDGLGFLAGALIGYILLLIIKDLFQEKNEESVPR